MSTGALFLNLNLCPGKEQSMTKMVSSDFDKRVQMLESSWHNIKEKSRKPWSVEILGGDF